MYAKMIVSKIYHLFRSIHILFRSYLPTSLLEVHIAVVHMYFDEKPCVFMLTTELRLLLTTVSERSCRGKLLLGFRQPEEANARCTRCKHSKQRLLLVAFTAECR